MTLLLRPVLVFVAFACMTGALQAQDIHFSQFENSPLNLNPGLNGAFGGDLRFVGNYRSQWRSVRVPYTTFSASVENKIYYKNGENRYRKYFTGGLLIDYDKQGSLELTSMQIGIPIGYTMPMGEKSYLTLGVTPAFGQRSFDTDNWSFDAQFVNRLYDPQAPTMEDGSLYSTSLQYFDLSTGLNYRLHHAKRRSRLDIGGALHHVNRPDHDFWTNSSDVKLEMRKTIYGIGLVQITDCFDLLGHAMYQEQGGYRELVYGAGGRFMLNTKPYEELAMQVNVSFRHRYSDAMVGRLEFFYRTWSLGLSYDVNTSAFHVASNYRGGWEVSLGYRLYKIKPAVGVCPID